VPKVAQIGSRVLHTYCLHRDTLSDAQQLDLIYSSRRNREVIPPLDECAATACRMVELFLEVARTTSWVPLTGKVAEGLVL
jgi:hypothetical protein